MDQITSSRIREIKGAIGEMLLERHKLDGSEEGRGTPSKYWAHFCSRFNYMLGLPEEAFEQLRIHTYHLTSDTYLTYFFDTRAREFRTQRAASLAGIPREYWLFEPDSGIGFSCEGGLVSLDTLRFQHVVNTLYREGVLNRLKQPSVRRRLALEIGGGYGGLAYHLTSLVDVTYVMVDLPETLLFSAAYHAIHQPNAKTYLYSPGTYNEFLKSDISAFDLVLLPNYRIELLRPLSFDLVLNVESFQEMRNDQVEAYLDFISSTCTGTFLSLNQDAQPMNNELHSLSEMLKQRFSAKELGSTRNDGSLTRMLKAIVEREAGSTMNDHVRGIVSRILRAAAWRIDPPVRGPGRPRREFLCAPNPAGVNKTTGGRSHAGSPA